MINNISLLILVLTIIIFICLISKRSGFHNIDLSIEPKLKIYDPLDQANTNTFKSTDTSRIYYNNLKLIYNILNTTQEIN